MSYDLYVQKPQGNWATRLRLLVTHDKPLPQYLKLIHGQISKGKQLQRGKFNELIAEELTRLHSLGLKQPVAPDFRLLPVGSWFLQFKFALAKPYISKDDDPFYVAESVNPVHKDKVFKVPMVAASSWKGLLRWTTMQVHLVEEKDTSSTEEFARRRFAHTLLFGDEKGEETGETKDFARYLDNLRIDAKPFYRQKVQGYFQWNKKDGLPHHGGQLMFYPTFFDLIDVEVINPHSRATKAGTHPIYLECVPAGAKGIFCLLYVPFDLVNHTDKNEICAQAKEDLQAIAKAVQAMMLIYGFSAKRTSGYGTAENNIKGVVHTHAEEKKLTQLSKLAQEVSHVEF